MSLKKLSEDGLNKDGCELRLHKEDIEDTSTVTKTPSTLTSLPRTTNDPSCMQESPKKQKQDLNRQIMFLRERFPNHEVVSDISSGINYKRKGLLYILELLYKGGIREVVVAHRDRLCRFGFDLFDFMFKQHGALLTVLENPSDSIDDRARELSEDIMAITTVFTARYYGSRKYTRKAVDV
jgi:putative resolvase